MPGTARTSRTPDEITTTLRHQPSHPHPLGRVFFNFNSLSNFNPATPTRRLDTPADESQHLLERPWRQLRSVCKTPYRVLDAPDLADDFYSNLVDWSSTNVLGVGLGSCVYLWTVHTAAVLKLMQSTTLAIGTLSRRLHIYDTHTLQVLRTYLQAHAQRIGVLAWNAHILSSGSRDRMVHQWDVRESGTMPFRQRCGLKWSGGGPQNAMLASGSGSSLSGGRATIASVTGASVADPGMSTGASGSHERDGRRAGRPATVEVPRAHTAAVKALAWDPHMSGILAMGGGTQDKTIRFWNMFNGTMLNDLDTGSQLVSTHGFLSATAQNQICIWKYPSLDMVASLTGHTHRVLYFAMSPDGETITLRFWNAFSTKENRESKKESKLDFGRQIR
ncbi:WD40-repeat-containing domain protein [Phellopilus nigrolimitatus]|nr:WD40-repeat-containing domain protein [Phellopilus nigrolimitatus]